MAKFRGVWCSDPNIELAEFCPQESDNFLLNIQAFFGPRDSDGSESFNFTLCTSKALVAKYGDQIVFLRHHILMAEYNYDDLIFRLEKLANSVSGETWHELALKLARYGHWEFEDYTP